MQQAREMSLVIFLPPGGVFPPVNMATSEAPEERLKKFKYRGKEMSVSINRGAIVKVLMDVV